MKTILYFRTSNGLTADSIFDGVAAYARQHDWNAQVIGPVSDARTVRQLVALWHADGCIVNCGMGENDFPPSAFADAKVIYLEKHTASSRSRIHRVLADNERLAGIVTRELCSLGVTGFGFVPFSPNCDWSRARERHFRSLLAIHGARPSVFRPRGASLRDSAFVGRLAEWLCGLPRPCGVFAANDAVAERVLSACSLVNLAVPDDIVIIGIDNDTAICERTKPTLASVSPGHEAAGRTAAALLDQLLSGKSIAPIVHTYCDGVFVRRDSARRLLRRDPLVAKAVEHIRLKSCEGLSAARVAELFPGSRRSAEIRFRAATGHSILEEINGIRLTEARRLLKSTDKPIGVVATLSGYRNASAFTLSFKKQTGMTPLSYRRNPS